MTVNINEVWIEAKENLFQVISIPFEFWFGLPKFVHILLYAFLIWFGGYICYIIYTNRTQIFNIP